MLGEECSSVRRASGEITFKNGETLDERGIAVFADDPRADKRE